ncbi:hypothetical protein TrVFT333_010530 [Trichoderma virens FT-333]|nr:hypothetical protein TrVFT333_010530 [Trichoderma virens FT-333]
MRVLSASVCTAASWPEAVKHEDAGDGTYHSLRTREAAAEPKVAPSRALTRIPLAVEKNSEGAVAATMTTMERQQPALPPRCNSILRSPLLQIEGPPGENRDR